MSLLRAGETCWRPPSEGRARLLVDCADYFLALREALLRARRSVYLLGWSFDPRAELAPQEGPCTEIGRILIEIADRNPQLDVRLLVWRSALPISATQDFFPHRAKPWFRGSRVRFELDDNVPLGACHHQKVVVIDDAIAFVGGADFANDRWDTVAHPDDDPLRRTIAKGRPSRHEVMVMVDGAAAAALGELFRLRWRDSVGEIDAPLLDPSPELWPDGFAPEFDSVRMAVARTGPAWRGSDAVREIAALTLQAISEAKSLIYMENQYFAWPLAVEALAARLAEPDGPEIVLVCSAKSPSYFDRLTMDRARSNALWRLKSQDIYGRFRALAPFTAAGRPIIAHAKVMVVDDRLLRVSSANLNNRSHGFDTECEVAIEARTDRERATLAAMRDRMAGHWIDQAGPQVAEFARLSGSLAEGLWALDAGRRLKALEARRLGLFGEFVADFHIGDPTDMSDSWRPWRRRRRQLNDARRLRAALAGGRSG